MPPRKTRGQATEENQLESRITADEMAHCKAGTKSLNRLVSSMHEYTAPKCTSEEVERYGYGDEYGGITGTLRPGAFVTIGELLTDPEKGLHPDFVMRRDESIFLDVGSGTGRPSMYIGCLPLRASIGFDVDPMQVSQSQCAIGRAQEKKECPLRCPVATFHADVLALDSFEPSTHVFAFLGYSQIVQATARLVATSRTVKVLIAVVLHEKELREVGILHADKKESAIVDADVVMTSGLPMPGGRSYMAYAIPMIDSRRERILEAIDQLVATEPAPESSVKVRDGPTIDAQVTRLLSGGPPIGSEQEREQLELERGDSSSSGADGGKKHFTRSERRKRDAEI